MTYGREPTRAGFDSWAAEDDRDAAHQLLRHLEAAGAEEVALVRGTDRNAWNLDYTEVYLRWCAERAQAPRLYEQPEGSGVAGGEEAADRILADGLPDAVLCLTGRHAAGLQRHLQDRGFVVPRDVMVATGSDSEHSRASRPAITAIQMSSADTADALLDLLQAKLDGGGALGRRLTRSRLRCACLDPFLRAIRPRRRNRADPRPPARCGSVAERRGAQRESVVITGTRNRLRYTPGGTPVTRLKRRRKNAGSSYPTCQPTASTESSVCSRRRFASSTRSRWT